MPKKMHDLVSQYTENTMNRQETVKPKWVINIWKSTYADKGIINNQKGPFAFVCKGTNWI